MTSLISFNDTSETMQHPGDLDPSPSSSSGRWHPKLTPYRLLVLGTTIAVGTAKTFVAQEERTSASTTLEWISGIVIFLILYTMSTYDESPRDPPPHLEWIFHIDCMDYVWSFLSFLHISRPLYSSEPDSTLPLTENEHVPVLVTLYRLLISFTTAFFGLTKATITYFGYSCGANWVDWTLGVFLTSILFIMGLYENNSIEMWHTFFVTDYSTEAQYGIVVFGITFVFLFWIGTCFWLINFMYTNDHSSFLSTKYKLVPLADLTPLALLREKLFAACFMLFLALITVVNLFATVVSVAATMNLSKLPKWTALAEKMMGERPMRSNGYIQLQDRGRLPAMRLTYHTVICTTFLLGCSVYLAFWVVCTVANVEEGYTLLRSDPEANHGYLAFLVAIILFELGNAGATAFLMLVVAWKAFFPPLWRYWTGQVDWDWGLLF